MTIIAIYVDDIILTGNDHQEIEDIKAYLHNSFSIKDLGKLHYFLGIEVNYLPSGIVLSQSKFTKELLEEAEFKATDSNRTKKVLTPLPMNLKLSAQEGILLENPTPYKSLVGKLNLLTNTRPDLAYTVQTLSQFMQSPRTSHWKALQYTLTYVYNTCGQ